MPTKVITGDEDGMFFLDGLDKEALRQRAAEARAEIEDAQAILAGCINRGGGDVES